MRYFLDSETSSERQVSRKVAKNAKNFSKTGLLLIEDG